MKKSKKKKKKKVYTNSEFIKKLRRLADSLETGKAFSMQVAGERITVPGNALINIEHEKSKSSEELEFQIKWKK